MKGAYTAEPHPHLATLDHISVKMIPAYKSFLKTVQTSEVRDKGVARGDQHCRIVLSAQNVICSRKLPIMGTVLTWSAQHQYIWLGTSVCCIQIWWQDSPCIAKLSPTIETAKYAHAQKNQVMLSEHQGHSEHVERCTVILASRLKTKNYTP